MMAFLKSLYSLLGSKVRWKVMALGALTAVLSINWLIQFHWLVSGYEADKELDVPLAVSTLGSFLLYVGFAYFQGRKYILYTQEVMKSIGNALWKRFLGMDYLDFRKEQRMYFFDVFMTNFWRLRSGYQGLLANGIPGLFMVLFLGLFLLYLQPVICLALLLLYGLIGLGQVKMRSAMSKHARDFHGAWRQSAYALGKLVDQFELFKMGRGVGRESQDYDQSLDQYLNSGDRLAQTRLKWSSMQLVLNQAVRMAMVILVFLFYQNGQLGISSIVSLAMVIGWMHTQLNRLQGVIPSLLEAVDAHRFLTEFEERHQPYEVAPELNPAESYLPIESISLSNLSFGYESNRPVLKDINLKLEKGSVYLLKGNNASGKTTLAKLLIGFLKADKGRVMINGSPLNKAPDLARRSSMSYLHQDFSLFYGTALENFSFGSGDEGEAFEEIFEELMADVGDSDYHIGERGERLSGGQKQRLALIREFGRKADVYVLDEPLNHLDAESTEWLKQAIGEKKKEAIILIISHLEGFESLSDHILHLKNGKLHAAQPEKQHLRFDYQSLPV